ATAAALAAERFGAKANELDSVEALRQIGGHADDDRRLPVGPRYDRDDARADPLLQIVGQGFQLPPWNTVDYATVESDLADPPLGRFGGRPGIRQCPTSFGEFPFKPPPLVDEAGYAHR